MSFSKIISVFALFFAFSAQAEIAVIANPKNNSVLDVMQIRDLFLDVKETFPDGSKAKPVDQAEGALKNEFYKKIADKDESDMNAYWANLIFTGNGRPPKTIRDVEEIKKYIRENVEGIAYIDKGAVDPSVKTVLVIK